MQRRSREQWRAICAASLVSGLTVRAYAERIGVNPRTLAWWRSELRDELVRPSFVELATEDAGAVVEGGVRIAIGNVLLTFETLPPAAWVAELAEAC